MLYQVELLPPQSLIIAIAERERLLALGSRLSALGFHILKRAQRRGQNLRPKACSREPNYRPTPMY